MPPRREDRPRRNGRPAAPAHSVHAPTHSDQSVTDSDHAPPGGGRAVTDSAYARANSAIPDALPIHDGSRLKPVNHTGPMAWVQLRNLQFGVNIFRKMIGRTSPDACDGDLVRVYDRDGVTFGTALLNRASQISLRMLTFGTEPLEENFLEARIQAAANQRAAFGIDAVANTCRLINAEGDRLPGLIVDRYGSVAVVQIMSLGIFKRRAEITALIKTHFGVEHVIIRADQGHQNAEAFVLRNQRGDLSSPGVPNPLMVHEHGVRFYIDLEHGHKTGFFCDQRDNRRLLAEHCAQRQVLDICCYTGGFSIGALVNGHASHVTAVDLDEKAIATARRNAQLNAISTKKLEWVHADGFAYLRQMKTNGRQFDVVVLDPPKLIADRDAFDEGRRAYFDLNKLGLSVLKPGGLLLTCSCSGLLGHEDFLDMLRGASRSAGRRLQIWKVTGAGPDHPVMAEFPQGWYLKCAWCRQY